MEASIVFEKILAAYETKKYRVIANVGGCRSGKSYSTLQFLLYLASNAKKPLLISIVSETMPHLKRGCMRDFQNIIESTKMVEGKHYQVNRSDNVWTFGNGKIEFFSVDSPQKVLGPQRDILFINECNHIPYETYRQLSTRTSGTIFLDWNPAAPFWFEERGIEASDDTITIHSTYKDNPFLSEQQVKAIEANKNDTNWWRVYGLGLVGSLEGTIYEFEQCDSMPLNGIEVYGIDFGFTNDPTAIVRCKVDTGRKEIYAEEVCYKTNMLNKDIIEVLSSNGVEHTEIYADCAEPKTIAEIRSAGFNIRPCYKGKSITAQISYMKGYKLFVSKKSLNLIKELRNYIWAKDSSGNTLNQPIDKFNHILDALRYAIFTKFNKAQGSYNLTII